MLKRVFQPNSAEQALIELFDRVVDDLPATISAEQRTQAFEWFRETGLPTRKVEDWHYTDLRARLSEVPRSLGGSWRVTGADSAKVEHGVAGALDFPHADVLASINRALAGEGVSIVVGADTEQPIAIEHRLKGGLTQSHVRSRIHIDDGVNAVLTINENCDAAAHFLTSMTDVDIGRDANLTVVIGADHGQAATTLSRYRFTLGANARLTCMVLAAGGRTNRVELDAQFVGEGAHADILGISLVRAREVTDIKLWVDHLVENTTSSEIFRSVADGSGHSVFQGLIKVAPGAQKTDAKLMTNALLLSDDAQFSAKPELEIFADDVQCGHGATSGQIDDDSLFYLMARGIPRDEAVNILVRAFVAEIFEKLDDPLLSDPLMARLSQWMETAKP